MWPFETGWAPLAPGSGDVPWLQPQVRIVHAEIYPSLLPPLGDAVKDRGQARALWQWARDLDRRDALVNEFMIPPRIAAGSPDDLAIRNEEGWILGCPP